MQSLTNAQILNNLQTDYEFGINFIIDNNPEGVEANLNANNFTLQPNPTKSQLKAKIDEIIGLGQEELAIEILQVPYLNQANNYTGNLEEPIKQIGATNGIATPRAVGVAIAIITLVTTIGGGILALKGNQAQQELAQTQLEQQQVLAQMQQQEIEANKVLGLPKSVFYGLIGLIGLVFVIIALRK